MSWRGIPSFSRNWRYCTRLPTVKYVGLHWPLLPYSLPIWNAGTSGTGNFSQRYPQPWKTARIRSSCFQVKPPNRIVTRLRSSAVKARSIGRWKCSGWSSPAIFRRRIRSVSRRCLISESFSIWTKFVAIRSSGNVWNLCGGLKRDCGVADGSLLGQRPSHGGQDTLDPRMEGLPGHYRLSTEQHPNSKGWLGGSKSYTGGTASRKSRRRRIWQRTRLG